MWEILAVLLLNTLIGGAGAVMFFIKEEKLREISSVFLSLASGIMLGAVFFHLFPHGLEHLGNDVFVYAVFGFVTFFLLEEYLHWHECVPCSIHPFSFLVLVGDSIHNFLDGLIVAFLFYASPVLGWITSASIILHEIPQQLGIFGTMIHAGIKKEKALIYAVLAQSTSLLGGIVGIIFHSSLGEITPYIVGFVAGSFLYIVGSDLIPEVHEEKGFMKLANILVFLLSLYFMTMIG